MPRYSNFPTLIDELRSFTISDLKKLGYFKKDTFISGTMNWINRYNEVTSSISIGVNNSEFNSYLELDYKCNGEQMNYRVNIVMIPSNLGKGNVKYFICPFTNKRCSKLHLINGKFMHRSALYNPLYSKQVESKRWREMTKMFGAPFELESLYEELYSKGFTRYYDGKPTKRYQKLLNRIRIAEGYC
jgi:hypothetical protein